MIEQKLENVTILLNEISITKSTIANLQNNSETFSAITGEKYESASNEVMSNKVNELCIVKWLVRVNEYQWYIGYISRKQKMGLLLTIYTQLVNLESTQWVYPSSEDIPIAEKEEILHCKVEGEWNLDDLHNIKYVLRTGDQIIAVFNEQQDSSSVYKGYMFPNKMYSEYSSILQ